MPLMALVTIIGRSITTRIINGLETIISTQQD